MIMNCFILISCWSKKVEEIVLQFSKSRLRNDAPDFNRFCSSLRHFKRSRSQTGKTKREAKDAGSRSWFVRLLTSSTLKGFLSLLRSRMLAAFHLYRAPSPLIRKAPSAVPFATSSLCPLRLWLFWEAVCLICFWKVGVLYSQCSHSCHLKSGYSFFQALF